MSKRSRLTLTISGLALLIGAAASANAFFGRQYYSVWYPQQDYYYRYYYYQPYVGYSGYRYHTVYYYYNTYPSYYYYYNNYSGYYWGRAPIKSEKPSYSLLAEKDRRKKLEDIPESAFPPPGEPPPIPESKDKVEMELPPKDLPTVKAKAAS